jgi:pimeloyl-ACP methyl ester carboxylesterase
VTFPEVHPPETDTAAPPVVLLHGGNVANWMWEPQLPALTDRTVITPDLPGFGARTSEDWPGLDAVADDVVARHGGDEPFDLVGLSLGAVTALRVLARHPGRVRSAFLTGRRSRPRASGCTSSPGCSSRSGGAVVLARTGHGVRAARRRARPLRDARPLGAS